MTTLRTDSTHSGITIDYADGSGFVHGGSGPLTVYSDEFKSVKDVPPANFLEQFGKDLKNTEVSDLSQIKWIFDGKKAPADFKEKMLEEIKKLDIDPNVAEKLEFKNSQLLMNEIEKQFDNIFIISKP